MKNVYEKTTTHRILIHSGMSSSRLKELLDKVPDNAALQIVESNNSFYLSFSVIEVCNG